MMSRGLRERWWMAGAVVGTATTVALLLGDQVGEAVFTAALFTAVTVALALGGRSETVRAVRGDLRDERVREVHLRSVALAGWLVTMATLVGFMVQVARGRSGAPFDWLAAIGGFSYLAVYLRGLRR